MLLYWQKLSVFLLAMMLLGASLRRWRMAGAAGILLGDWIAGTLVASLTGATDQWIWNGLIDGSAAFVCCLYGGIYGAIIGLSFVTEVAIHIAYGGHSVFLGYSIDADTIYYWLTFFIAWAQGAFLFWGFGEDGGGKFSRENRDDHRPVGRRFLSLSVAGHYYVSRCRAFAWRLRDG